MPKKLVYILILITAVFMFRFTTVSHTAVAATYYVSSSTGDDNNNGLSDGAAFATINHVNSLNLEPGDTILFKCGDIWRAESLVIIYSGTAVAPITFGSYPADCADKSHHFWRSTHHRLVPSKRQHLHGRFVNWRQCRFVPRRR